MKNFIFLLLIVYAIDGWCQCKPETKSFQVGEDLQYDVYYNWGIIWLHAGEVFFKVQEDTYENTPAYHFYSVGTSFESYDWIYKVRDTFQTYLNKQNFNPLYFSRNTLEGGYEVDNQYEFNYESNQIKSSTYNSKSEKKTYVLKIKPCTFDVLSIIYYARTLSYIKYKPNQQIPITVIIDGKIYDLYIRYLGKERIKSKDGKNYDCIKFSPLLVEGTIFSGGEDMTVWVTDDQNRVPILVEAKILVGSIKTYLRAAKQIISPPLKGK